MGRGFSFRILYRVVFFSFCLIFACFYHGGGSEYDRREDKTKRNKLKYEFKRKPLNVDVSLEQDERVSNLTENSKQIDGRKARKQTDLSKMVRKGTAMKTLRSERIQKSPLVPFSTLSPFEVNVPRRKSTTISHSSQTEWQNNGSKNVSSLENQIFHENDLRGTAKREKFASLTTQHLRNRREIDSKSEYTHEDLLMCNDSIINIKKDDEYKVRTDFTILYKNKVYDYTEYRVLNDTTRICNSASDYVRNIWKARNKWVKGRMHKINCNKPIRTSLLKLRYYYTVNKQFTVFYAARSQYFTRNDYGVKDGKPCICREKFKPKSTEYTQEDLLMCNDSIINIRNDDEYKVRTDFSILYKNKVYDYTEYRVLNDGIQICNSADNFVRNIWKVRNKWVKARMHQKSCNKPVRTFLLPSKYYTVNKQFTVYYVASSQYFTRNDYRVKNGKPSVCYEKFKPKSTDYTQEDLSMCNDSIINIKYDDEYKVRTDFSILHMKNKVYDCTEYRVLNDGIKICNSADNFVRNVWKVRNKWIKARMHRKGCNKPITYTQFDRWEHTVLKNFRVIISATKKLITKYGYGVVE
ncbi:Hypothetical predicted protein, partial [Paramuricea clavata]